MTTLKGVLQLWSLLGMTICLFAVLDGLDADLGMVHKGGAGWQWWIQVATRRYSTLTKSSDASARAYGDDPPEALYFVVP